jgi:hypothetical protein
MPAWTYFPAIYFSSLISPHLNFRPSVNLAYHCVSDPSDTIREKPIMRLEVQSTNIKEPLRVDLFLL